jgi:GTP-binding protein
MSEDERRREPPRARSARGRDIPEANEDGVRRIAGTVAVVGYPNVGKSTLVNRLVGRREAVVHEERGVTRDRKQLELEWNGVAIEIVDTGGIDIEAEGDPIARQVSEQARVALAEADLVLFVVDAQLGVTSGDMEVAEIIRRSHTPVVLVANKADNPRRELLDSAELYELGLGDPFPVSAIQGTNSGDLLDLIVARLDGIEGAARDVRVSDEIGIAILGRPNVGKSSLLNAITGQPRAIVSDVPGTTRDSFDTRVTLGETTFRLIDTAGMRRKRRHRQEVEYWSEVRALHAAQRADIALVLVDAQEGLTDHDLHVADEARKAGCATIVVVSKWDIQEIDLDHLRERLHKKLRQRPVVITSSAVTGRGVERVLRTAEEVFGRYTSRVGTGELNRVLKDAAERRQAPLVRQRRLKLLYGAQVQTRPPRFRITVNDRRLITAEYAYYLENRIREATDLESCPVIIDFVAR